MTVLYGLLGVFIAGLAGMFLWARRRWARWEAVLDHVARSFGGQHRKGYNKGFAVLPGSVEAKVDGRHVVVETETTKHGPSGDSHEKRWMCVRISTTARKPEFFGAEASRRNHAEITDYSARGPAGAGIEVGGYTIDGNKLPKRLRKALEEDPDTLARVAEFFGAGGCFEHGNVVLRTRDFEWDAERLVTRIREMSSIASMMD